MFITQSLALVRQYQRLREECGVGIAHFRSLYILLNPTSLVTQGGEIHETPTETGYYFCTGQKDPDLQGYIFLSALRLQ